VKQVRDYFRLDDLLFIIILAMPCVFAVDIAVRTSAEKAAIILTHDSTKNGDGKSAIRTMSELVQTDAQVR